MWYLNPHPTLGIFVAIFSTYVLYFGFRLLADKTPGLVLNEMGLKINSKIGSGGTVPWKEIEAFFLTRYGHDYQLVIKVKRPDSYLARGGAIHQALNAFSAASFGSPVRVTTGLLDYDRNDLSRTVNEFRDRYAGA